MNVCLCICISAGTCAEMSFLQSDSVLSYQCSLSVLFLKATMSACLEYGVCWSQVPISIYPGLLGIRHSNCATGILAFLYCSCGQLSSTEPARLLMLKCTMSLNIAVTYFCMHFQFQPNLVSNYFMFFAHMYSARFHRCILLSFRMF